MKNFVSALALSASFVIVQSAAAQQEPDVDALRKQIDALQKQLQKLEAPSGGKSDYRVTTIGGNRVRSRDPQTEVRIYDLGDLFAVAPPYRARHNRDLGGESRPVFPTMGEDLAGGPGSAGGGLQGGGGAFGGGGFFRVRPNPLANPALMQQGSSVTVKSSMNQLIEAIKSIISPDLWTEKGGPASITTLGNALLVSADTDTHTQIDALLNLFRERWGTLRTISVQAYWLWLNDASLEGLLEENEQQIDGAAVKAFGLAKADEWKQLMQQVRQADANNRAGYRAAVTCYNGQTVFTMSGSDRMLVTQVKPILTRGIDDQPEGQIAYQPELSIVHEGAALQVTPITNISGKTVVIDIHSRVSRLRDNAPKEAVKKINDPKSAEAILQVLDRSQLMTHRLSTTLRVPVGRPMLVGGMTFENEPRPGEPNLYLFVKVAVQELRNDQTDVKKKAAVEKNEKKPDAK